MRPFARVQPPVVVVVPLEVGQAFRRSDLLQEDVEILSGCLHVLERVDRVINARRMQFRLGQKPTVRLTTGPFSLKHRGARIPDEIRNADDFLEWEEGDLIPTLCLAASLPWRIKLETEWAAKMTATALNHPLGVVAVKTARQVPTHERSARRSRSRSAIVPHRP